MNNNYQAPGPAPRGRGRGRRGGGGGARGQANWRAHGLDQAQNHLNVGQAAYNQRQGAGAPAGGFYRPPQHLQALAGEQDNRPDGRQQRFPARQNQDHRINNRDGNRRNNYQRDQQEGNRDNRNDGRNQNRNDRTMGFKTLEEIAQCDNQDVIAKVHEKKEAFIKLLVSDTDKGDIYVLIMEIISKVCQSTFDQLKLTLLIDICNTNFMRNLRNYITDLPYVEVKAKNNLYWNNQTGFWNNFVGFCQSIIEIFPSVALQKCRSLIEDTSKMCLERLKERHGFTAADEYNTKLQQLRERLTIQEKEEAEKVIRKRDLLHFEEMDPPNDFRSLTVLPTRDDLLDQQPFLRPNIIKGRYQDTEHYLDVQFRLLREDCFGPLRDGINDYIQNPNKKKYDNIRVYHNIKFIEPFISKNKIGETVQLDEKAMRRFKRINWAHSKRFIFGSLLLFTKDKCNSFVTATILERDVKLLSQGKIPISIVDKIAGENIYNDDSSYTMIESEVYFEPYLHVLKALQDPKFPEHIAMSKYIIQVDPIPQPPAYLTPDSVFKIDTEYSATSFRVLNPLTWPSRHEIGLNKTQYAAFELALTHEFAVIQGPPGTGKTYLGVKVAKTLIENLSTADSACLMLEMIHNRSRQTRLHITNRMDLRVLPTAERWALYFRWANVVLAKFKRQMKPLQDTLDTANTAYEEARMMIDLKILKGIKVVGMTTSGAARLRKLLQALAPAIVIVEEAAEVLEQHIVTSLTKDCQHLILIGDHQQLRPSAAHNKLARDFNMEISLFERMIKNGIHSRTLGVQHRMRPEIASLISPHIYPDLQNHPSVQQFPNVLGMADNLFFLTHNYKEEEVDDSASKSNQLEADMTLNLANYLMKQGYEPEDVTILAAYSGQMFYMRKQREKFDYLKKVKITVVDNYQGEESKIILLSLVRNNSQDKIGFLGIENRVCVALSRARHGFYIFGNIDILKRKSTLWTKISETLDKNGSLGTALMLKCQSHPEQISTISSPADFNKVPEGGCLLKCNYEMPCGHVCTRVCHGYDRGHVNIKCFMPCERILCELDHQCPLKCSAKCQPCERMVNKLLPCGHKKQIFCYLDPADPTVKCGTIVKVRLPDCQHEVDKPCHMKIEAVKCPVRCIYRVEQCGHECRLNCHVKDDPYHEKYLCMKPCARAKKGCTVELVGDRGNHQCTRLCHEPCDNCTVEVTKKRLSCKHSERVACCKAVDAEPCRKNCARVLPCGHFCKKKCHEPCGDCKQMVKKTIPDCNHEIKVACMTPATRDLCREKCERILSCGHACTQRCDQICDAKKCTQQLQTKFAAPCGHSVALPCNAYNAMVNEWNPEVLLKYCRAPCGVELACEHTCAGTCGECHQGRLHLACQDQCNRTQICGHLCNEPCNQVCPPCNRICEIRCSHSRCNKMCGAPCKPCQEPCSRRCPHGACTRRCGEPCSRPACDEACPRRLPCGHRCRGLCGEPCPDICNICRPDDFPTDFLGDEYEDDVKFIRLQDCTHVLDVENMDNLMMGDTESISIRACPTCRKPIINTQRYKDLVNSTFKNEINPIKERVYGNEHIISQKQKELYTKILELNNKYKDVAEANPTYNVAITKLFTLQKTQKKVSLPKLETYSQYLEILDMIGENNRKYNEAKEKSLKTDFFNITKLICNTLIANINKISQQLQQDIGNELHRMNSLIQLEKILNHTAYLNTKTEPKVKQAAEIALKYVLASRKFNKDATTIVLKQLQEAVKVSGIVTAQERALIIKAIGSKAGSWYKCPNGHIYSIGQCGGAMEVSKCADCGAAIGGSSHTLLSTNRHAGEVDGSRFAAWSNEYNNMANWDI